MFQIVLRMDSLWKLSLAFFMVSAMSTGIEISATEVSGNRADALNGPWTIAGSPYIVTGNVTIPAGQTLTINPGVVIKFNKNTGIFVYGILNARGNSGAKISFTSNGDLVPDWWSAIYFYNGSGGTLEHCNILYNGYWDDAGIKCMGDAAPNISNSVISQVSGDGIRIFDTAAPKVINTSISNTGWPIHIWGVNANLADFTGSSCTSNANHGIRLEGFSVPENQTRIWKKYSGSPPYSVPSFTIGKGGKMVVEPGLIVKVDKNAYISVYGTLEAKGTGSNPITFSYWTDDVGGDTNGDKGETLPEKEGWNGIFFYDGSHGTLEHCKITYTGYWDDIAIKIMGNSAPVISDCEISHIGGDGVRIVDSAAPSIVNTTISDVLWWPVHLWGANASVTDFTGSECVSCGNYGFRYDSFSVPEGKTTTWKKYPGSPPYSVHAFTIAAGGKLAVDPGLIIKVDKNAYISVYGTLEAKGTGANPITFTYWADDAGGDTNGDKGETLPEKDGWNGIFFYNESHGTLEHCKITYAGYWDDTAIKIMGNSAPVISDCEITHIGGDGVRIVDSAAPSIVNTTISDVLWWPVHLWGANASVTDFTGSECVSCGNYGFRYDSFSVPEGKTTTWKKYPGSPPYSVHAFTIAAGGKLVVDPGLIVKMDKNAYIGVYGTLDAQGTASEYITFTAALDDIGGDTNGDLDKTSPVPDEWHSIIFYNDSYGVLDYCRITYAGYWEDTGILCLGNSAPVISNCEISYIAGDGVRVRDSANPRVSPNNAFTNISDYGVRNTGSSTINARNNWWDHPSGPYHETKNPAGKGNKVSDRVDFSPYMQSAPEKNIPASVVINTPPASITADGKSTIVITTTVKDASGKPLSGQNVKITVSNGLGTISPVRDNGDGTYSATYTAPNQAGTATINITSGGASSTVNITLTPVTQPGGQPALTASPTSVKPGDIITVTYSNAPGNERDWIGMYFLGPLGPSLVRQEFLNSNKNGIVRFTAIAEPGNYEFRMFNAQGQQIATSNLVVIASSTVPDGKPSISASPASVKPGEIITVTYADAPGNYADWIGIYLVGSTDYEDLDYMFLEGNKSGTLQFTAPSEPGDYNFRMFPDAEYEPLLAVSNTVRVSQDGGGQPTTQPEISASPVVVNPGQDITVTYANAPGNYYDWISINRTDASDRTYISWQYLYSNKSGTLTFKAPAEEGSYEFRMFPNNAYEPRLAVSNIVKVTGEETKYNKGMVSYWKFDEDTGTTAIDSADSNPGTVNGATWASGLIGGALKFDGVNDYVLVPDSSNLDLTTEFTLEAWINPSSLVSSSLGAGIISKVGGSAGNNGYQLGITQGSKEIFCQFNAAGESWPGNQIIAILSQPIPVNQWSHIVCIYDSSVMKIYLNGENIASKSVGAKTIINSAANLRISGDDNNHAYFPGYIDEAAVYNIALTVEEIKKHYENGLSGIPIAGEQKATLTLQTSPSSLPADGKSTATITATVKDASGNPLSGQSIQIKVSSGKGLLGAIRDNGDGTYTATYTASTQAGKEVVTATFQEISKTVEITLTPITTTTRNLTIPEVTGAPGEDVNVPINISDASGIAGTDVTVTYDKSILTVKEVKTTPLSSGMNLVANTNTPGTIVIRMAGSDIGAGSGAIIDMVFSISPSATTGTEIPVELESAEVFDALGNNVAVSTQNGKVKIGSACLKGDVSGDGKIKSNDAILALRISAGLMTATTQQLCAADMNDDGRVKSNDAILILRKSAGLAPPNGFLRSTIGGEISLRLEKVYGEAGRSFIVPLIVDNPDSLAGGDICISYDSAVLRPVKVTSEKDKLLAFNLADAGVIRISFASVSRLKDKTLARVEFDVLSDDISPLVLRTIEVYGFEANSLSFRAIDGSFISYMSRPVKSALLQNFPNPFNPETWVPYQLREHGPVKIRIYAVSGELVRELDLGYKNSGLYISRDRAAYWDGKDKNGMSVASGLYFYSIQASGLSEVKKMILAK